MSSLQFLVSSKRQIIKRMQAIRFNQIIRKFLRLSGALNEIREDIGLLMMMKEVDRNEKASREEVIKVLNS